MEVTAVVTRKDLIALHLHLFPRLKTNRIFFILLAVACCSLILFERKPDNLQDVGIAVFASVAGAMGGTTFCLIAGMIPMLLTVGPNSGVTGIHHYSLSELGFHERTDVNETLQKWRSVASIIRLPNYLFIRITGYLFYIVPRRAFATTDQFNAFYERAIDLKGVA